MSLPSDVLVAQPLPARGSHSALHAAIAGELREMREMLEKLAEVLVSDAEFAAKHICQLQSFDYLIQHADECATLLERVADGEDSLAAAGGVRLGTVQARIRSALEGC